MVTIFNMGVFMFYSRSSSLVARPHSRDLAKVISPLRPTLQLVFLAKFKALVSQTVTTRLLKQHALRVLTGKLPQHAAVRHGASFMRVLEWAKSGASCMYLFFVVLGGGERRVQKHRVESTDMY